MDYNKLADLIFADITDTVDDLEKRFPERNLPEGARVTRFAPSPTGYMHIGGLYAAMISRKLAKQSGGVSLAYPTISNSIPPILLSISFDSCP